MLKRKVILVVMSILFITLLMGCSNTKLYNLKLDANGGKFSNNESTFLIEVDGKSLVTLPSNPSKAGYTFSGWFWDKDL